MDVSKSSVGCDGAMRAITVLNICDKCLFLIEFIPLTSFSSSIVRPSQVKVFLNVRTDIRRLYKNYQKYIINMQKLF